MTHQKSMKIFLLPLMIGVLSMVSCFLSSPPSLKQIQEAVIASDVATNTTGSLSSLDLSNGTCFNPNFKTREYSEPLDVNGFDEFKNFPGKSKYFVTEKATGTCGENQYATNSFTLERHFLFVRKGLPGLPKDKSGKWSVWPLQYKYNQEALASLEESYDELSGVMGSSWFMIQTTTGVMEEQGTTKFSFKTFALDPDHIYGEIDR